MSEPSNMYITATKMPLRRLIGVFVILCGVVNMMTAQDEHVRFIQQTQLYATQTEVYGYVSGGLSSARSLRTANNDSKNKALYSSFLELGASVSIYNTKHEWLHFNGSLGYKFQVYTYDKYVAANAGVFTHWLDADANIAFHFFGIGVLAGVRSDIFLNSTIKNSDHFRYEGLYKDCFSYASLCLYTGLVIQWSRLRIEARIGGYPIPPLSAQKISYYNLTKTYVDAFYFEVRACFRVFTTGQNKTTYNLWRK